MASKWLAFCIIIGSCAVCLVVAHPVPTYPGTVPMEQYFTQRHSQNMMAGIGNEGEFRGGPRICEGLQHMEAHAG